MFTSKTKDVEHVYDHNFLTSTNNKDKIMRMLKSSLVEQFNPHAPYIHIFEYIFLTCLEDIEGPQDTFRTETLFHHSHMLLPIANTN